MTAPRPATPHRRPDVRLLIGGALVLLSALGAWALVASLDDGVEVVAAKSALTPGALVDADDFVVERVRLGAAGRAYLTPSQLPAEGVVVTRTVLAGELVPASAVADGAGARTASVVVDAAANLPSGVRPGARVDVWSTARGDHGEVAPPLVLVSGAEVAVVGEADGAIGGGRRPVELAVPRDELAAVLAAVAAGDAIDLVPAGADARVAAAKG